MGRDSGSIAVHASLSSGDVNLCLVPEVDFDLGCVTRYVEQRLKSRHHCVVVVAEGAGESVSDCTCAASPHVLFKKNRTKTLFWILSWNRCIRQHAPWRRWRGPQRSLCQNAQDGHGQGLVVCVFVCLFFNPCPLVHRSVVHHPQRASPPFRRGVLCTAGADGGPRGHGGLHRLHGRFCHEPLCGAAARTHQGPQARQRQRRVFSSSPHEHWPAFHFVPIKIGRHGGGA